MDLVLGSLFATGVSTKHTGGTHRFKKKKKNMKIVGDGRRKKKGVSQSIKSLFILL